MSISDSIKINNDQIPIVTDVGHGKPGPGWVHPTRIMNCHDFLYIVKGTFIVGETDKKYYLKAGDCLFLKAGLRHYGDEASSDDVEWYFIHFILRDSSPAPNVLNEPISSLNDDRQDAEGFIMLPKYTHIPSELHSSFITRLELIYKTFWFKDMLKSISLNLQTMNIFLDLVRVGMQDNLESKNSYVINKMQQYLLSTINRTFNAKELSRELGMNYNYLSTLFKKYMGLSPIQYHTQARIQRAAAMLKNHEGTINELSMYLGFENVYHFSNVFKKVMGCSPRNYINKISGLK